MISYHQFCKLPVQRQAALLTASGTYLELIRREGRSSVELYAMGNFYVEVFFDEATGEPEYLQPFEYSDRLLPYLESISIDSLFATK